MEGAPEAVMDFYNAMLANRENQSVRQQVNVNGKTQTVSGTGEACIEQVRLFNMQDQRVEVVITGQTVRFQVDVAIMKALPDLVLGFMIKDRLGQPVFGTNTHYLKQSLVALQAGQKLTFDIKLDANMGPGHYSLALALHAGETHVIKNFEWRDLALVFQVVNTDKPEFVGVTWLSHQMNIKVRSNE
jgi:lipopolysaccharide transport system ATP-binding protein